MEEISILFETQAGDKKIINFKQSDIEDKENPAGKQWKFFNGLCEKSGFELEDVTRIKFFNGPETIEYLALCDFVNLKMIEIAEGTKILRWAFLGWEHAENEKSVSVILPNSLILDPVKRDDGSAVDPFFGCELKYVFIDNNPEIEDLVKERHPEAIIIHDRQKFDELVNNDSKDQKNVADDNLENKSINTDKKSNVKNDDQKFEKLINDNHQHQKTKNLFPVNKNDDAKDIKNKSVSKYKNDETAKNTNSQSYSELLTIKSILLPYLIYMLIIITWHKMFAPTCNNKSKTNNESKSNSFSEKIEKAKFLSSSNSQIPSCSKNKSDYNITKGYF